MFDRLTSDGLNAPGDSVAGGSVNYVYRLEPSARVRRGLTMRDDLQMSQGETKFSDMGRMEKFKTAG